MPFANAKRIEDRRDRMFAGERINITKDRQALLVAVRKHCRRL
ncbi:hypothetical protein HGG75_27955 [Ochrobactrum pseudogrignonense]|nr:hypothetical protein [Brucella pseudogrignonensis]